MSIGKDHFEALQHCRSLNTRSLHDTIRSQVAARHQVSALYSKYKSAATMKRDLDIAFENLAAELGTDLSQPEIKAGKRTLVGSRCAPSHAQPQTQEHDPALTTPPSAYTGADGQEAVADYYSIAPYGTYGTYNTTGSPYGYTESQQLSQYTQSRCPDPLDIAPLPIPFIRMPLQYRPNDSAPHGRLDSNNNAPFTYPAFHEPLVTDNQGLLNDRIIDQPQQGSLVPPQVPSQGMASGIAPEMMEYYLNLGAYIRDRDQMQPGAGEHKSKENFTCFC